MLSVDPAEQHMLIWGTVISITLLWEEIIGVHIFC